MVLFLVRSQPFHPSDIEVVRCFLEPYTTSSTKSALLRSEYWDWQQYPVCVRITRWNQIKLWKKTEINIQQNHGSKEGSDKGVHLLKLYDSSGSGWQPLVGTTFRNHGETLTVRSVENMESVRDCVEVTTLSIGCNWI